MAQHEQQQQEVLVYFLHHLINFRQAELEAQASALGWAPPALRWRNALDTCEDAEFSPFFHITVPSLEMAQKLGQRTLLTKCMLEVWAEGTTFEELQASFASTPAAITEPYMGKNLSWKVVLDAFGRTFTQEQSLELINKLAFLDMKGPIRLKQPDVKLWLIISDTAGRGTTPINNGLPDLPYRIFLGREVVETDRAVKWQYTLSKRAYIGPTSMDQEMALLMCNMARVAKGSLVLDPYVGTGSILVAAAHHGAYTMGADIDIRVLLPGKGDFQGTGNQQGQRDIFANFEQYRLQPPLGLLRMDMHTPPFRDDLEAVFDAIIGDPPYGVRAGGRKMEPREGVTVRNRATHIPSTKPYLLGECLRDLVSLSARLLKLGGRLVFFVPASVMSYREEELPTHPAMKLVSNCEQVLTTRYSRRLITMEKVAPYDAASAEAHYAALGPPIMAIDQMHDEVYAHYESTADGGTAKQKVPPPAIVNNRKPFRSKKT